MFTTSAETSWNNMALTPVFPMLMQQVVTYLAGREFEQALRLPKKALVDSQVYIVDPDDTLALKSVVIIDREDDVVWAQGPINRDERIVISDPRVLRVGIKVRVDSTSANETQPSDD